MIFLRKKRNELCRHSAAITVVTPKIMALATCVTNEMILFFALSLFTAHFPRVAFVFNPEKITSFKESIIKNEETCRAKITRTICSVCACNLKKVDNKTRKSIFARETRRMWYTFDIFCARVSGGNMSPDLGYWHLWFYLKMGCEEQMQFLCL